MTEHDFLKEINGKNINYLIGSGINVPVIPTLSIGNLAYSFEELITHELIEHESIHYKLMFIYFYVKTIKAGYLKDEELTEELAKKYYKFVNILIFYLTTQSNDKPKRVNIFTTNYDLIFETTFDAISQKNNQVTFNDGSYGFIKRQISSERFHIKSLQSGVFDRFSFEIPVINLIKLHGSLSWAIDKERIKVDYEANPLSKFNESIEEMNIESIIDSLHEKLVKRKVIDILIEQEPCIFDVQEEKFTIDIEHYYTMKINEEKNLLNQEYTLYEAVDLLKSELDVIQHDFKDRFKFDEFNDIFKSLIIVSPTKEKFNETIFQQHYYQMLRILSQELERKQTVLIVFGFSFNDEHILDIIRRSAFNNELMIYIIAFSEEKQKEIKEKFNEYNNIKYFPSNYDNQKGDFDFLLQLLEGTNEHE